MYVECMGAGVILKKDDTVIIETLYNGELQIVMEHLRY